MIIIKYLFMGKIDFKMDKIILCCATLLFILIALFFYLSISFHFTPVMFFSMSIFIAITFLNIEINEYRSSVTLSNNYLIIKKASFFGIFVRILKADLMPEFEKYLNEFLKQNGTVKTFSFPRLNTQCNLKIIFKNKNLMATIN